MGSLIANVFGRAHEPAPVARYGMAVAAAAAATLLRLALDPIWGDRLPFIWYFPAILVAAWFAGFRAGVLTTLLCAMATDYLWLAPVGSLAVESWADAVGLVVFAAIGVVISGVSEAWRRASAGFARSEERLQAALESERAGRHGVESAGEQLRLALEAGRMGTWEYVAASGVVRWSPSLEAMHGYAPGEFPGTFEAFREEIHPEDRERVLSAIQAALEHRREHHVEYRIVRRSGEVRWVEGRGLAHAGGDGAAARMVGVCLDVTERRQAEEKFRTAVEAAPAAMLMVDERGRIVLANALAERVLGYSRDELLGRSVESLLPARFRDGHAAHRASFFDESLQRPMGAGRDLYALRKDGSEVPVEVGLSPIRTHEGRFVLAAVSDISARKRAEADLQEADRRKDEFLAMLAHELRNPLGAIINAAQVLKEIGPAEESIGWARDIVERQAAHLARLVDDLLDVSRISRGRIVLERRPMRIDSAVALALETARPLFEERRQSFSCDLPSDPVWVEGDATRLAQAIGNLLSNASRYSAPGAAISLTTARTDSEVVIRVRDGGIGIAPEMLPRIFDLFVQAEPSPARARGGLGLGLALARRLAEMHGGRLEAHSEGLGRGSEFVLRLPVRAGKPPAEAFVQRSPDPCAPVRRRVLVVDDDVDSRETLAVALSLAGHDVRMADDGSSALAEAAAFRPDAAVLDIGLPGMSGYELATRLRKIGSGAEVLVALSGFGQQEDRRRGTEAGFDHYLVKPASPESVLAILAAPRGGATADGG
jgi:PAS domain S-box-containing protein